MYYYVSPSGPPPCILNNVKYLIQLEYDPPPPFYRSSRLFLVRKRPCTSASSSSRRFRLLRRERSDVTGGWRLNVAPDCTSDSNFPQSFFLQTQSLPRRPTAWAHTLIFFKKFKWKRVWNLYYYKFSMKHCGKVQHSMGNTMPIQNFYYRNYTSWKIIWNDCFVY